MKTPEQVFARHAEDPVGAALELEKRGLLDKGLDEAAIGWCEHYAGHEGALRREGWSREGARRSVALTLMRAFGETPLFGEVAAAACEAAKGASFDWALMELLLMVWPFRARLSMVPEVIERWASSVEKCDRIRAAFSLYQAPELAYTLLGPLVYEPTDVPCFGCPQHPRAGDDGSSHFSLLYERRRSQCAPHALDDDMLARLPVEAMVTEPGLVTWLRLWFRDGLEPPAGLEEALVEALAEPERGHRWRNAVVLLCRLPDEHAHERAVASLTAMVRDAADPAAGWALFFDEGRAGLARQGLFTGAFWGRDRRRQKLVELARAFLTRGLWPATSWNCALSDRFCETRSDDNSEWQREVMAEALLQMARDAHRPIGERERTLRALGALAPKGTDNWAKALSKIREPEALARAAKSARDQIGQVLDADLGIADACDELFVTE